MTTPNRVRDSNGSPEDTNRVLEEMYAELSTGGAGGGSSSGGGELAAAFRLSQFSWNFAEWEPVEGVDINVNTKEYGGPVWIEGSPGLIMAPTLDPISITYRLFGASTGIVHAHGFVQLSPQPADGVSVGYAPPLRGRLFNFPTDQRVVLMVKGRAGLTCPSAYVAAIGG
jgi:hypothetical protein